ncbi:HutD/Ves family protein [Bosea sp. NBC_00550]|uniref:HutD/Ves family protein n=1 Tax=Bosea sp. NBC_00550 TaxID=2969621 RepID=UPI00222F708B|nr:HutD family protein [Bosea sp. NBC_00550]UZF92398.1 HutD family protein [Bosea sp. NBC_00550]
MRIIRAADCKVMPWKNGGGTTTEIAVFPEGAPLSDFDWRISMAHVGTDGPFSSFPGIDRTLSLLTGNGIHLAFGDGETVALDKGTEPFFFAADRAVDGVLVDGPIDDLNVMSRRGAWSHKVERLPGGSHEIANERGLLVLVARRDVWQVNGSALAAGDSAVLPAPTTVSLRAESGGELFAIRLSRA